VWSRPRKVEAAGGRVAAGQPPPGNGSSGSRILSAIGSLAEDPRPSGPSYATLVVRVAFRIDGPLATAESIELRNLVWWEPLLEQDDGNPVLHDFIGAFVLTSEGEVVPIL